LAIADNRASEVGLSWSGEVLANLANEGEVDLAAFFRAEELDAITMRRAGGADWDSAAAAITGEDRPPFRQMTFTLHDSQFEVVERALAQAKRDGDFTASPNENSNGNALAAVCEAFLGD
jgi:hypothetical protein